MKFISLALLPFILSAFGFKAMAQEEKKVESKKETEEIVIRKKGKKDATITIQLTGDKVLINGKPLVEFKDDAITINKRKMIVRDGNRMIFGDGFGEFDDERFTWHDNEESGKAFLGVHSEKTPDGAKITQVSKESAAEKAGLKEGDVITKLGDQKIDGPESLLEAVTSKKANDEVKIAYTRDGKSGSATAKLQERKDIVKNYSYKSPDGSFKTFTLPRVPVPPMEGWNGMDPGELMDDYDFHLNSFSKKQKLGIKIQDTQEGNGVKVINVEDSSAAALAGLKKYDIILEIAGEKITNTDEAREQLQINREKSNYKLKARRNGNDMTFDIKIPKKLKTTTL